MSRAEPAGAGGQTRWPGRPLLTLCDCNGKSSQCMWDLQLLRETGNGYRCLNCADHTEGANCERCKEGFFRRHPRERCMPCRCDPTGSAGVQCDVHGRCRCKRGVTGDKCERCQDGFQSFSEAGCSPLFPQRLLLSRCDCNPAGSTGQCVSRRCVCKAAAAGDRCDSCKQGYYNLDAGNPEGCSRCFCYGHSSTCSSAENYSIHKISSTFQQGDEGWQAQGNGSPLQLQWSPHHKEIYVATRQKDPIYFVAPARFLGKQQLSYGQMLFFNYRVNKPGRRPSQQDVVLEGAGFRVTSPLMPNGKVLPCQARKTYTFRLDEHPSSNWSPRLTSTEFHQLIDNLTALRIRATYGDSTGYLSNVILVSAQPGAGPMAPWVEQCECPSGYQGQFCQRCAPGYRRENSAGRGALGDCIPCNCQGGGTCDPDTGDCYSGDENRELRSTACPSGFYSLPWDPQSCRPCPCQSGYGCTVLPGTHEVVCDSCPLGTSGPRCELCADGYFGDPLGERGLTQPCQACRCSTDDPNASEVCNPLTGKCQCKAGFFGDPSSPDPAEKCRACNCNSVGSEPLQCRSDGSCICKPGFEGPSCEHNRCPACYSQVKAQVDQYLQQLRGLEALIQQAQFTGEQVENAELERKMSEVEEMLQQVLREARSLQASDRSLGSRGSKLKAQELAYQGHLDEIRETARRLQSLGSQYQSQVQDTRRFLERVRLDLKQSQARLEGQASTISHVLSCSPDKGGDDLAKCLLMIYHAGQTHPKSPRFVKSWHAWISWPEIATREPKIGFILQCPHSSITGGGGRWGDISIKEVSHNFRLKGCLPICRYEEAKLLSSELEADANRAASSADGAYQGSQSLLLSLAQLSKIDTALFQVRFKEARQLQQKADSLTGLVEMHMAEYKQLQSSLANWEEEMKGLLQKGQNDKASAQLLSRANLAKTSAQQALSAGNATLADVDGILKSLREFTLQVGDKQEEATEAMQRLPLISNMVAGANEKTRRAEAALDAATAEAQAARRLAGEAKEMAQGINQDVGRLALEANRSADGVLALERGIASLRQEAKGKEDALYRKTLELDAEATRAAAGGAGSVVQEMLRALEDLLRMMDQPEAVDEHGVNLLEMDLRRARARHSQLKELLLQLEGTASQQKRRIQTLEQSIHEILADIKNLEGIRDNLPPKCYNIQPIETP
uniref:Laminin subunit gamma 2 n=1 Tax=Varanus komodoensis TaxID=61221 RepID=A0A8D2KTR3_VARKO